MNKKMMMLGVVCAVGLPVFAGTPLVFISGATRGGNFEAGATIGTTGMNLSSVNKFMWNTCVKEKDWRISGGKAVAKSEAGTGLGQMILKSDFPKKAWVGKTQLTISFDWTTQEAGDEIEFGLGGWNHSGRGANIYGLANGHLISNDDHYGKGTRLTARPLVAVGCGANGKGKYTATITLESVKGVDDLAAFDALGIIFFSTVNGSGGRVTIDNVELICQ